MAQGLFGNRLREDVLVLAAALGETYPSELAKLLKRPLYAVQRVIDSFDRAGVLASRRRGTVRLVSLETRYSSYRELYALLLRLSEQSRYEGILQRVRRRPRASGKSL